MNSLSSKEHKKKRFSPRSINIALSFIGLFVIVCFIILGTNKLIYDETNFVPNILLFDKLGLSKEFLLSMHGSPGPLYSIYHHFFFKANSFNIITVRLANYFLFLILLLFIFLSAKLLNLKDPFILSLNFIIIPFTWVVCGLGLTEIPAMTCAIIGFYFFLKTFVGEKSDLKKIFFIVLSGTFFSLAILGRVFYLMIIVAIIFLILFYFALEIFSSPQKISRYEYVSKKSIALLSLGIIVSLVLPFIVFAYWGALTPPLGTAAVGGKELKIVPWYGILGISYSAFIALLLAPSFFVARKNTLFYLLIGTFMLIIGNIAFKVIEFAPLKTTASKFLSTNMFSFYEYTLPAILLSLSCYFIYSTCIQFYINKFRTVYVLTGIIAIFIVLSTVKVTTQFSSRYVAQAAPFFLLFFADFEKTNWNKIFRILIGLTIGFLSLYSYYTGNY
jgi:hypothetical protein